MSADKVQKPSFDMKAIKPIKITWKHRLCGAAGKIRNANKEIEAVRGEAKEGAGDANDGVKKANIGAETADKTVYQADLGEDQSLDAQSDADAGQVQSGEGQSIIDESPTIESTQAATNEKIATMTEGLSGQQEEVMSQLQERFTIIAEAGEQLMANGEEVAALQAELAEITADSAEGGGFSTGMAAAAGPNGAYTLSVPTGAPQAPQAGKSKKGGLISSGAQQTPQTQGAQQGQQAQGGQSADAAQTARAQEIYARLVEINEQNCTIRDTITTASEEAMVLQTEVTELMETQTTEVSEDQANAEAENTKAMETLATFQEISTVGTLVNITGGVVKGFGKGMIAAGLTVKKGGESVSTVGKFLKGMFGGIKLTGQAVAGIFPVFTAAPGTTVATVGKSGEVTGGAVSKSGKLVAKTGDMVNKTGKTVAQVGQGVKLMGQGIQAVGAAGTMVVGIQQGNWSAIIGGAVGFLGSAISCIGNVGQFAQSLGAAKDGFFAACAELESTINEVLGSAGTLQSVASKGNQMGANALQNGTTGFTETVLNVTTTFVPGATSPMSNNTTPTSGGTTAPTTNVNYGITPEEPANPEDKKDTSTSSPEMRDKAKKAGLKEDDIKGKTDDEIKKMIDKKNADSSKKPE